MTLDNTLIPMEKLMKKKLIPKIEKTTQKIKKKKGRKKWTKTHQKILVAAVKLFKDKPQIIQSLLHEFSNGFIHNKIVHLEWREYFKKGQDP